ncbi:MAG TPA: DNA polymerase III subunit gamma/tau [Clostridiales bacterium]|nr:DNA polymerase III subunit gamma/tau [Clostridiales bacterium]
MRHVSLYRKYRPVTWEQIVGQNHIVRTIKNQINSNNISHAYLFTGSRGTGKTSSAKIFARAINCLNPVNGSPCNECKNCKSILNEASFDVVELDAASNNSVNDIRSLIENISIPPMNGKYKVYIVDEVHMLSQQAFNAFLKTLEEPPEYVVFILATTEVHKIPNTILSRCMQFDFRLIPVNELTEIITNIFDKENYKYELEACRQIAIHGEGSARDALSIADMCMAYAPEKLTYNDVLEVLGGSDFETLYKIADAILNENISRLLEHIDSVYHKGKGISTLNKELANFFKDLITIKNVPTYSPFSKEQNEIALKLAKEHDNYKISRILEIIASVESNLRFSAQPKVLFEANLIKAAKLITSPNIEALNSRIKTLESKIESFSKDNVEYFKKFLDNHNLIPDIYEYSKNSKVSKKTAKLEDTQALSNNVSVDKVNNNKVEKSGKGNSTKISSKVNVISNVQDKITNELPFEDKSNEQTNDLPFEDKSDEITNELPFKDNSDEVTNELPFEDNSDEVTNELPFKDNSDEVTNELPFEDNSDEVTNELPFEDNSDDLKVNETSNAQDKTTNELHFENKSNEITNELPFEDKSNETINELPFEDKSNDVKVDEVSNAQNKTNGELHFENNEKQLNNKKNKDKSDNMKEAKKLFDALLEAMKDQVLTLSPLKQADSFRLENGFLTITYLPTHDFAYKRMIGGCKDSLIEAMKKIDPKVKLNFELKKQEIDSKLNQLELEEVSKFFDSNLKIKN